VRIWGSKANLKEEEGERLKLCELGVTRGSPRFARDPWVWDRFWLTDSRHICSDDGCRFQRPCDGVSQLHGQIQQVDDYVQREMQKHGTCLCPMRC